MAIPTGWAPLRFLRTIMGPSGFPADLQPTNGANVTGATSANRPFHIIANDVSAGTVINATYWGTDGTDGEVVVHRNVVAREKILGPFKSINAGAGGDATTCDDMILRYSGVGSLT